MMPVVLALMLIIGKCSWIEPNDLTPVDFPVTPDTQICSTYTFTTFSSIFHLQPPSCVHDVNVSFAQHHQMRILYVRTLNVFYHPCMLEG
jgi:hypothetical protein